MIILLLHLSKALINCNYLWYSNNCIDFIMSHSSALLLSLSLSLPTCWKVHQNGENTIKKMAAKNSLVNLWHSEACQKQWEKLPSCQDEVEAQSLHLTRSKLWETTTALDTQPHTHTRTHTCTLLQTLEQPSRSCCCTRGVCVTCIRLQLWGARDDLVNIFIGSNNSG